MDYIYLQIYQALSQKPTKKVKNQVIANAFWWQQVLSHRWNIIWDVSMVWILVWLIQMYWMWSSIIEKISVFFAFYCIFLLFCKPKKWKKSNKNDQKCQKKAKSFQWPSSTFNAFVSINLICTLEMHLMLYFICVW